ncbi:MFS transporter [Micromonospora sp. RP3T]|uniref:MFS transporter n=1 Tax=Micromonospora sp. RP3T TaxID=2135446 RepID=UPI000D17D502|nr:MFS transporter [Micromonospora sp. RP3T]PTA45213.1 MFS transporter [Micromonospora sp. RP3T]
MTDSQQVQAVPQQASGQETPFVWTRRHTMIVLVICAALVMETIDVSIMNVALPPIKDEFGFTEADLSWVVNGYLVPFGGFLLLFGRVGDIFGHRRMLVAGVAIFAVASLVAGLAPNGNTLIVMRALQGVAAALISPMTLALLARTFPEGPRAKAIAAWGMAAGLSGVVGLIVGGLLTVGPGWRWIFLINVPVSLLVIVGVLRWLGHDQRPARRTQRFDLVGAIVSTVGVTLLTVGVLQVSEVGWGSARAIVPLTAGLALLAYFVFHETRVAEDPLLPASLIRIPNVAGANITQALVGSGMFAMLYIATLYQQDVLHYSPLQTGLGYIPQTLVILVTAQQTPKLVAALGMRLAVVVGGVIATVGMALLALSGPQGSYLVNILGPSIIIGVGMALTFLPLSLAAGTGVPDDRQGVASGLINVSRITGGALGLSVVAAVAAGYTGSQRAAGVDEVTALTDGFQVGFLISAGLLLLSVFTALLLPPKPANSSSDAAVK